MAISELFFRHKAPSPFGAASEVYGSVQEKVRAGMLDLEDWDTIALADFDPALLSNPNEALILRKQIKAFATARDQIRQLGILENPYLGRHHWELICLIASNYDNNPTYSKVASVAFAAARRVYTLNDHARDLLRAVKDNAPFKSVGFSDHTQRIVYDEQAQRWHGQFLVAAGNLEHWDLLKQMSDNEIEDLLRSLWFVKDNTTDILQFTPHDLDQHLFSRGLEEPEATQAYLTKLRAQEREGVPTVPFPVYRYEEYYRYYCMPEQQLVTI